MALMLTDEQQMLRDQARGFLDQAAPIKHLRQLRDSRDPTGFSPELWRRMGEMGWAGALVPEAFGGVGLGFVEAGVILEEMGRTLTPSPFLSTAMMAACALGRAGSAAQKQRFLPAIAGGAAVIALAVDETAKHGPRKTALPALRAGNGFRLDGSKTFVADGHVADVVIVAARTAGAPGDAHGITLFLVDPNSRGFAAERTSMVDSRNAARLTFDGVEVTADDVLGEIDDGFAVLDVVLNAGRGGLAAELVGAAREAFDRTVAYLKERRQFGRPIGEFQALQHRAAHLMTEIELARSLALKALQTLDAAPDQAGLIVAAAKAKAGQVAKLAGNEAIQMFGGVGMTDEYDIGLFAKRIRVAQEMLGDANYHAGEIARLRGF